MEQWFSAYSSYPFEPFTTSHVFALTIFFIGSILLLATSRRITARPRVVFSIRIGLFILLFFSEASYQFWAIKNDVWSMSYYMPLHLCGIASIVGMITLATYHPKLIKLNYFIGITPALVALVTPDLLYDYQHFRFWKFFIHHMAIFWTSLFLIVTTSVRVTWMTMLKAYVWLVLYGVVVGMINSIIGSNYMFLGGPPDAATPLDYLGDGVWYYINLGILSLTLFSIMVIIYRMIEKRFTP